MKKKNLCKAVAFLLVFGLLFGVVTEVLKLKDIDPDQMQEKYTTENLYELEKNSLDVLILGSSQVTFGISPVEMYDHSGISAYGIGMGQGSIMGSYHWLIETCKRQTPSVVLLEMSSMFESLLDNQERKSLDSMRLSMNKVQLARAVAECSSDSAISYLISVMKYHSRWDKLTQVDFGVGLNPDEAFRGLNITDYCKKGLNYNKVIIDEDDPNADVREMYDYHVEYFHKIVEYCQENEIPLVLFKTPKTSWTGSDYKQVAELADEAGVEYLDFNQKALLEAIGYDVNVDMMDTDHLSISGADKLSDYLADYLSERYDLPDHREDPDFDLQINRELYDQERTDAYLCTTTDPVEWLALLKAHSPCRVFVATSGDVGGMVPEEISAALADLGFETDLNELSAGNAYVGLLVNGEVRDEIVKKDKVQVDAQMDDGTTYRLIAGEEAALTIKGKNCELAGPGINIVVYDEVGKQVIEAVAIDVQNEASMTCLTRSR